MTIPTFTFAVLLPLTSLLADDASSRAHLMGIWQQEASSKGISISIAETKGSALRIITSQGDQKLSDVECKPVGVECEGTSSGKKIKVVMYFSGPGLVQLETAGPDVTKRQLLVTDQTDILEVVITSITGTAKTETIHLKRMPSTAGR